MPDCFVRPPVHAYTSTHACMYECTPGMIKWTGGTNKCLEVWGGADNDGTNVAISGCDPNSNNQKLKFLRSGVC